MTKEASPSLTQVMHEAIDLLTKFSIPLYVYGVSRSTCSRSLAGSSFFP